MLTSLQLAYIAITIIIIIVGTLYMTPNLYKEDFTNKDTFSITKSIRSNTLKAVNLYDNKIRPLITTTFKIPLMKIPKFLYQYI